MVARRRLPRTSGTLTVDGLHSPVDIHRDRWGIPHIYAGSPADAYFAQGFVHAQDRLFQMDLRRRIAHGTLSEAFGAGGLATDRFARTLGIGNAAREEWAAISGAAPGGASNKVGDEVTVGVRDEVKESLQAYAEGVNACLGWKGWKKPLEFTLLGYEPRPWEPVDSVAFARLMIWQLAFGWHGELVRQQLRAAVGDAATAEWGFRYPASSPVTLPGGITVGDPNDPPGLPITGPAAGGGSNAWAISGRRSATGHPLLCNDPHLFLSAPSVWYENHLSAPGLEVTGASLAGIPAVMIGHNSRIAWGITVAFTDCQDLFEERFDGDSYEFRGEWHEAELRDEEILVKHEDQPVRHRVVTTRHGPIVADGPEGSGARYALSAVALTGRGDIGALLALNRASDWKDFSEALRLGSAAQLNFVYADVDGNIGYRVTGNVPVRSAGDGTTPAPGWAGTHEWVGFIPYDEMPHALNPAEGFIVSANHKILSDGYPHYLGNAWMNGYRARRIVDVLAARDRVTVEDCSALHADVGSIPGARFAGIVAGCRLADPDARLGQALLQTWDGRLDVDSVGGSVYEVARHELIQLLLAPVPEGIRRGLTGTGPSSLLAPGNELYGNETVAMLEMIESGDSWWVRQAGGRDQAVETALKRAVAWLRSELGRDPRRWRWGRIHRVRFPHPIGLRPPLDRVYDRGPFPIGGDTDTPAQSGLAPNRPYDARASCPSYRQIVDLGDLSKSVAIHAPGQSGMVGSRHYDDLLKVWRDNRYHPMLWSREEVLTNSRNYVALRPRKTPGGVSPGRSRAGASQR
jgi:penicillin amidase